MSAERERRDLADALLQLCGPEPQKRSELERSVREEWGECTASEIGLALRDLARCGAIAVRRDGYQTTTELDAMEDDS